MHLIINTRPESTSAALQQALQQLNLPCVQLPGMAIAGPQQVQQVRSQLLAAVQQDVWIFTSINAIEQTFSLLAEASAATSNWPTMAVLGQGSRHCLQRFLRQHGMTGVDIIAPPAGSSSSSEGLLQHSRLQQVSDQRILILNAPGGRDKLLTTLQQRGFVAEELAVYRRVPARLEPAAVQTIADWAGDLLTLWTSSTSIRFLQQQLHASNEADAEAGKLWPRIMHGRHLVLSARQQRLLQQLDAVTIIIANSPDTNNLAQQLQELAGA